MPIDIKNVLVCDAVDQSCVELLKTNGISVDYKLKLPKNELIEEAKVREKVCHVSKMKKFCSIIPAWNNFAKFISIKHDMTTSRYYIYNIISMS
jgi:hypothetical protein